MMSKVDLHDATLLAVHICWKNGTCVVDMRHGELGACTLTFSAISHLTLPDGKAGGLSRRLTHSFNAAAVNTKLKCSPAMQSRSKLQMSCLRRRGALRASREILSKT